MCGSQELHPLLPRHPTPFLRLPRPSEKPGKADHFRFARTSLPRPEGKGGREASHAPFAGGPWSGVELLVSSARPECACAVSGFPPPPLPLPLSPAGPLGPAGPCSPAPVPVGFVSTGRRHPGCPLNTTLGTSLRRLGAAGTLGVAGGLGVDLPSLCRNLGSSCPVGSSGHRPHFSLEGSVGTESAPSPRPVSPRCDGQMLLGLL